MRQNYDPRQSAQLLEGLGYTKGADGLLRDGAVQRLNLEIRSVTAETQQKLTLATVDFWRQIGVDAEPYVIPLQLARDPEQYATFPGAMIVRNPAHLRGLVGLLSNRSPLPENRFTGNNYGRYRSEAFDAIISNLVVTIPVTERMQILGQAVHHMSEQLNVIGLVFNPDPILIANRLQNIPTIRPTWNSHEWDVK